MKRIILTLALLSFSHVNPAYAGTDWLPIFQKASIQYWGGGVLPPCGQPVFEWGWTPLTTEGTQSGAMASFDTCVITWNKGTWPIFSGDPTSMCAETVHEIGHLYGHNHSEGGVMTGAGNSIYLRWREWPPCRQTIKLKMVCKHDRGGGQSCEQRAFPRKEAIRKPGK